MGGVSESGFEVRAGAGEAGGPAGLFRGVVSSSNSGGFASVRPFCAPFDLSIFGIELKIMFKGGSCGIADPVESLRVLWPGPAGIASGLSGYWGVRSACFW